MYETKIGTRVVVEYLPIVLIFVVHLPVQGYAGCICMNPLWGVSDPNVLFSLQQLDKCCDLEQWFYNVSWPILIDL